MKPSCAMGATTETPSQSPTGMSVGPCGASGEIEGRPRPKTSGGGEKMPCRRPGSASPTTPSCAWVFDGRTTWMGSVGAGTNTDGKRMPERNVPAAPVGRAAWPPNIVRSAMRASSSSVVTSTRARTSPGRQCSTTAFVAQALESVSTVMRTEPSASSSTVTAVGPDGLVGHADAVDAREQRQVAPQLAVRPGDGGTRPREGDAERVRRGDEHDLGRAAGDGDVLGGLHWSSMVGEMRRGWFEARRALRRSRRRGGAGARRADAEDGLGGERDGQGDARVTERPFQHERPVRLHPVSEFAPESGMSGTEPDERQLGSGHVACQGGIQLVGRVDVTVDVATLPGALEERHIIQPAEQPDVVELRLSRQPRLHRSGEQVAAGVPAEGGEEGGVDLMREASSRRG
ncbi:hypothetical protein ACRAWC_22690 [Leifsonia sp. L25]|uniref:hypothetical protein n=1 Tax=Leifsonia sp. L25 TaxID=3423957 RepID=UPI003D68C243